MLAENVVVNICRITSFRRH